MTQIGTRMKSYEANRRLAGGAVIVRVDGKAFHTWTKQVGARKPFDRLIIGTMGDAMRYTAQQIQGCKLAYTQSDEVTFLLANTGEEQLWFGGKQDKVVSLASSMFTYYFNNMWGHRATEVGLRNVAAFFDARAHNIPVEDAANNFVWRQQDWMRNSVQMLGRAYFSHKELIGKSVEDIKEMLLHKDVDWHSLQSWEKFGTFFNGKETVYKRLNYDEINEFAGIDVTKQD